MTRSPLLGILGIGPLLKLCDRTGQAFVWLGVVTWIAVASAVRRHWDIVA